MEQNLASNIIDDLRFGLPSIVGVNEYSAGDVEFLDAIKKRHLQTLKTANGKIRFVSGSWGTGKTHLLARIRNMAFDANCLVSSVQVDRNTTPFDQFEEVFYGIATKISTPDIDPSLANPLSEVFRRQLFGPRLDIDTIDRVECDTVCQQLMENSKIDIDFRRIVCGFWETYRNEPDDTIAHKRKRRNMAMEWFTGRGRIREYRDIFGVQKLVNRNNARQILSSLAHYAIHAGFTGVVVLLDEAEMNFSTMRMSQLRRAHNNLLHLINTIQESVGLFMVFATTPDFFIDEDYGVQVTGPLSQRIGSFPNHRPIAVQPVWNIQYLRRDIADYQLVAQKLRKIYVAADPESDNKITSSESLDDYVLSLKKNYPPHDRLGFCRRLVQAVIRRFDLEANGEEVPSPEQIYDDIVVD